MAVGPRGTAVVMIYAKGWDADNDDEFLDRCDVELKIYLEEWD